MRAPIALRPAGAADAPAVAKLHAASWRMAYRGIFLDRYLDGPLDAERLAYWQDRLAVPAASQLTLVAEADGTPAGFACCFVAADSRWGSYVNNLHTDPARRGLGVGRALMAEVASRLVALAPGHPVHLFCLEENAPAQGFYRRIGGTIVERCEADEPDGGRYPALRFVWPSPDALATGCR